MAYPENTPSVDDMLNMPTGELAQMPVDLLAAESLHSASLGVAVATVSAGALSFFVCHGSLLVRRSIGRKVGSAKAERLAGLRVTA